MRTYQSLPAVKGPERDYLLSLFLRTLGDQSQFAQGSILQEAEDFGSVAVVHHLVAAAVVLVEGAATIVRGRLILRAFCFSFGAPNALFALVLFLKAVLLVLLWLLFALVACAVGGGFGPVGRFAFGRKLHACACNVEGNKSTRTG